MRVFFHHTKKITMKKIVTLATVALFTLMGLSVSAQNKEFKPLTTWPYLYEDFQEGWITTYQGTRINYDQINVNLANGKVHYIDKGTIMEANASTIALLSISGDSFICASGRMVKVLQHTQNGAVVQSISVDIDTMNKADIGYGTSSIASTQNVSAAVLSTDMDFSINKAMDSINTDKYSGEELPLMKINGIYYKGMFYPGTRTDILNIPGIDKDTVKNYLKTEKIKFSNVDDLAKVVEYLYSL